MRVIKLKEINGIDDANEYVYTNYSSTGFYYNKSTKNVVFVNVETMLVLYICQINDLPEEHEEVHKTGTITENFALKLTETILKNT